jgi:hypothetical protein
VSAALYWDAAVVARRGAAAAALDCAWAREFLRDDASDRDQPALAYALAQFPASAFFSSSGAPPPACKPRCHWTYSPDDVAAKTGKVDGDRRFHRAQREGLVPGIR